MTGRKRSDSTSAPARLAIAAAAVSAIWDPRPPCLMG